MTSGLTIKGTKTITAQSASCQDCGWKSDNNQQVGGLRKSAYEHTFRTGHRTEGQMVIAYTYEEDA